MTPSRRANGEHRDPRVERAECDRYCNAARKLRGNVAALVTTSNQDLKFISQNPENFSDDVALIADGLEKVAAPLIDIYDVCARIEARQKGGS